jgi:hypothetical protein
VVFVADYSCEGSGGISPRFPNTCGVSGCQYSGVTQRRAHDPQSAEFCKDSKAPEQTANNGAIRRLNAIAPILVSHFHEILFRFLHQLLEADCVWARAPDLNPERLTNECTNQYRERRLDLEDARYRSRY